MASPLSLHFVGHSVGVGFAPTPLSLPLFLGHFVCFGVRGILMLRPLGHAASTGHSSCVASFRPSPLGARASASGVSGLWFMHSFLFTLKRNVPIVLLFYVILLLAFMHLYVPVCPGAFICLGAFGLVISNLVRFYLVWVHSCGALTPSVLSWLPWCIRLHKVHSGFVFFGPLTNELLSVHSYGAFTPNIIL